MSSEPVIPMHQMCLLPAGTECVTTGNVDPVTNERSQVRFKIVGQWSSYDPRVVEEMRAQKNKSTMEVTRDMLGESIQSGDITTEQANRILLQIAPPAEAVEEAKADEYPEPPPSTKRRRDEDEGEEEQKADDAMEM